MRCDVDDTDFIFVQDVCCYPQKSRCVASSHPSCVKKKTRLSETQEGGDEWGGCLRLITLALRFLLADVTERGFSLAVVFHLSPSRMKWK